MRKINKNIIVLVAGFLLISVLIASLDMQIEARDVKDASLMNEKALSYPVSNPQNLSRDHRNIPTLKERQYLYKNEKLIIVLPSGIEVETNVAEGSISPNKQLVAYTVKKNSDWGIEPYIYLYYFDGRAEEMIPLKEDNMDKFIYSWSPDSKYILLVNKAQSIGLVKGEIYSIASRSQIRELDMYDHKSVWINQYELIYAESKLKCLESCTLEEFTFTKLDIDENSTDILSKISLKKNMPIIEEVNYLGNSLQVTTKSKLEKTPENLLKGIILIFKNKESEEK